ncbi:trigger factor [Candidatus Saccharibacteria bacterium]|nr:trigger factor [Candidatus Saccharibacteria bacterium]
MKTKLKKLDGSRVELTATLDAADLKKAEDLAIEELAKEVRVEGFRKGKVPMEVAKKFIPENDLGAKTMDLSVRMTVVAAFEQEKQMPLLRPEISITKFVPGEMLEYVATVEVVPEVTLGDWKNLGVKRETAKIEEKDVKGVLDNIAKSFSEKKAIKRAAKLNDEVIIDFVGKKDGVAFPGGSADNYPLMLGSGNFIPGFEDGIVGHEPGDKFDLELTFPKDYGVDDLAGVKTVFSVLLKQVNEVTVPKIDDELAKKVGPFKDLKALKEDIKKNLALQTEERLDGKFKDDLVKALVKKSKIGVIPDILINDQMHGIRDNLERNAKTQGLSAEEYLKRGGETMESWEKQAKKVAEENVKASLCLQNLALAEKVTVDDKLVEAKIAELKDVYRKSPDALKNLKDPAVKQDIKNRLIIEATIEKLAKANK